MCSKGIELPTPSGRTLALRLTLWYASFFAVFSFVAVVVFYLSISTMVQRRTDQELINELHEFSSIMKMRGDSFLKVAIQEEAESEGVDKTFLRILNSEGEVLDTTDHSSWKGLTVNRAALERIAGGENHLVETVSFPERPYKVRMIYGNLDRVKILQMGVSLEEDEHFLATFRRLFGACLAVIIAFSALIGWVMAKRALSGIEEVTETALEISKGDFERRVTVKSRDDELMRLSMAFNGMLDRIQELITGMREMTDNIAHDLKTPITRMRGLAETELNRPLSPCQSLAADTMEECDHLLQMINTMLMISEAEAGLAPTAKEDLNLVALIRDISELFCPIAEGKGISVSLDLPQKASVRGDKAGFQRMLGNLLENAVKYTQPGGKVTISIHEEDGRVSIGIKDTGMGIAEHDLPNIFKRLYRCDSSRSQPGFGLGLSLARAVAHAHGGDIRAASRPGEGSIFTIILPL